MWRCYLSRARKAGRLRLLEEAKLAKIQERYLRPKNCSLLVVPKVNPELWDDLSDMAKARELGLQSLQNLFVKSLFPMIKLANVVVQAKASGSDSIPVADIYACAIDAVTLLGNSMYEFSMKRRELLKPEIAAGFKSLCRDNQGVTTWLFGDELSQNIRNIAQIKRMSVRKAANKRKFDSQPFTGRKLVLHRTDLSL